MQNGPSNKKTPEPLTNIKVEDRLRSLYGKLEIFMQLTRNLKAKFNIKIFTYHQENKQKQMK